MLAVLDQFLWTLRREGFELSPAQAIDAARAASELGFEDRALFREAVATVVVDRKDKRGRFDAVFDEFFSLHRARASSLEGRLLAQGFTREELDALRTLIDDFSPQRGSRLAALLAGGADLDHLLSQSAVRDLFSRLRDRDKKGFFTHRILEELGADRARVALDVLRDGLGDAIGSERAPLLLEALTRELDKSERMVRDLVEVHLQRVSAPEDDQGPMTRPFADLSEAELDEVRHAVRRLADRLRGAARVRLRHGQKARIDPARTARKSLATLGIPFLPVHRKRRRDRPKLVLLCDVSDSVRPAARFMLELAYAAKELFARSRLFVFVADLGEVTRLFESEPAGAAIAKAHLSVATQSISNYGRVFRDLETKYKGAIDRRTTLVVLGDGRTNFGENGAEALRRMRERAAAVFWLCPEPRATWGSGDNAMPVYAKEVTRVLEVACARDLERAAYELVARR